jgi:hypothetical protein
MNNLKMLFLDRIGAMVALGARQVTPAQLPQSNASGGDIASVLAKIKASQQTNVQKAFSQSSSAVSGITEYDLEQGAKLLYPITTILRNMIPRKTGGTGIQANWRTITAVNPGNVAIGLSEGNRGGFMSQTVNDVLAAFRFMGMDNYVTFEADYAAQGFDDVRALAVTELLQAVMEQEERIDLGGNASIALGTCGTVTATASNTGGFLADATYSVICVALTYDGTQFSTNPQATYTTAPAGGLVKLPYTRTNADGTTDSIQGFSGIQSAATGSLVVNGGTSLGSIAVSVAAVRGAFGYAWYLGTAGAEKLVQISGSRAVTLKYTNSTGQVATALPATDTSQNSLNYNGILTQIATSGSGAYSQDLGGAVLTTSGSGSGGIAEFDAAIAQFYANYRLIPTHIFMNGTDQTNAKNKILTGNTNLAPFFMGGTAGDVGAGAQFTRYRNPIGFGNQNLTVVAHPFMPQGTVMFYSDKIPYPLSNVGNIIQKRLRRDYYQVEWPVVTRKYTYGVYFDGVLQMYFMPAYGMLTSVGNG